MSLFGIHLHSCCILLRLGGSCKSLEFLTLTEVSGTQQFTTSRRDPSSHPATPRIRTVLTSRVSQYLPLSWIVTMAALEYRSPSHPSTTDEAVPSNLAAIAHIASAFFNTHIQQSQHREMKVVLMANRNAGQSSIALPFRSADTSHSNDSGPNGDPRCKRAFIKPLVYRESFGIRAISLGILASARQETNRVPLGTDLRTSRATPRFQRTPYDLRMHTQNRLRAQITVMDTDAARAHLPDRVSLSFNWLSSSWPISFAKFCEGRLEEIRPLQELSLENVSTRFRSL